MKQLEALERFVGVYLHEDWADDYPDLWHAIDDFVDGDPQAASHIRPDVEYVVARSQNDQEIQHTVRALGIKYYPPGDGWESYRAWLLAVAAHVEETLHKSPAA